MILAIPAPKIKRTHGLELRPDSGYDSPPVPNDDHNSEAGMPRDPLRTAVITCAVLDIEIRQFARDLAHIIHIHTLEQGLHNEPDKLRQTLQEAITRAEQLPDIQAIVLGYGLCSRGTEGVRTTRAKLVIPRAHDCITLLLGSKERYAEYVKQNPGTYWYSPGWNLHHIPPGKDRYDKLYQQYCEKYGQDNAQFLMEQEQAWFKSYNRATYVDLGVGVTEADLQYTRQCADWLGWSCDHRHGDPALLMALLSGDWDNDRFVVLEPGQSIRMTADERVIEPAPACPSQDSPA
ncbi:MAG: DUF1638 domain-containing protein [Planctomycetota bacterium]|nr:DUF1638 domain-containing protein [Planctomycetota bacterium]